MEEFCDCAKQHFRFLEDDYGCTLESSLTEKWGGELIYRNETTGIRLVYEVPSAFLFVFIYKLIGGEMVENPTPLLANSKITKFDFNDALPDSAKMKPAYEYGSESLYFDDEVGLSNYLREFATRLQQYGKDALKGDFSILPKIDKIIKKRSIGEQ